MARTSFRTLPAILALAAMPALAQPHPAPPGEPATPPPPAAPSLKLPIAITERRFGPVVVEVRDLTPRFLDFYARATAAPAAERMAIWTARYGFAAVPPGPRGVAMSAGIVAAAWPRYPAALPKLRRGAAGLTVDPVARLGQIATLLGAPAGAHVGLTYYVGGFEDNAFTARNGNLPVLALPIESAPSFLELVGVHEGTHAIHMLTAGLSGAFERPIAEVIVEEGLAMRVTQHLLPGKPDSAYTEHQPGWLAAAMTRRDAILTGLLPALTKADGQSVFDFTMGKGSTGTEREAYLAGWLVVGDWLRHGMTFSQIAHLPVSDMPAKVAETIQRLTRY